MSERKKLGIAIACLLSMTAYRAAADLVITYNSVVVGRETTKDLGGWPVNSMNGYAFTAANTGTGALTLTGSPRRVSVSGAGFTVNSFDDLPASIGAGASATFILSFDSTGMAAVSTASGSISIPYTGAPDSPHTFAVSIRIMEEPGAEINVRLQGGGDIPSGTSDAISFGNQLVNTSSTPRTVIVENFGSVDLTASVTTSNGCFARSTPAASIIPGDSSSFTITFTPTAAQAYTNITITINNNDPNEGIYTFTINGTGTAPEMAVSQGATSIANGGTFPFTTTLVNTTSDLIFTITNTGDGELRLSGTPRVVFGGTDGSLFSVVADPGTPVAASGGTTTFRIRFAPITPGSKTATVSIANNDLNENPYTFRINATCTAPEMAVSGGATGIANGGSFTIRETPVYLTRSANFLIANTGNGELRLSGSPRVAISGTDAALFSVQGTGPGTPVAAGGATAFQITFAPLNIGDKTATVSIANNDMDENPYTFTINGRGSPPPWPTVDSIYISPSDSPNAPVVSCTDQIANYVHFVNPSGDFRSVAVEKTSIGIREPHADQWITVNPIECLKIALSDADESKTIKLLLKDSAGNIAEVNLTTTASIRLDRNKPTITAMTYRVVQQQATKYTLATLTFSEPVVVGGTPTLTLRWDGGSRPLTGTYVSGSGTNALVFRHEIRQGDPRPPVNDPSQLKIVLTGGTVRDLCGRDADWRINVPIREATGGP